MYFLDFRFLEDNLLIDKDKHYVKMRNNLNFHLNIFSIVGE